MRGVGTLFAGMLMLTALAALAVYIVHVGRVAILSVHEQQMLYEKSRWIAEHANLTGNMIVLPEPADIIVVDRGVPRIAKNVTQLELPWPADSVKIYVAKRGKRVGVADPVASSVAAMASVASAPLETINVVNIDTEQVVSEAVREVLLLQYGPVLQPAWFAGPLLPGTDPATVAASGPLPGAYVDPERARVYIMTGWPVRDRKEYGETGWVRASCTYNCPPGEGGFHVYRRVLELLPGGVLHLEHREAAVHFVNYNSLKGYKLKARLTGPLLATDFDVCIYYDVYTCEAWLTSWGDGYIVPGSVDDVDARTSWEAIGGGAGSIYIPFLVTRVSQPETITLLILPLDGSAAIKQTVTGWRAYDYCKNSTCVYTDTVAVPAYVSVKLHVLPPNSYDPGKLVVARGLASRVDQSWQARLQEALYTATVLQATPMDHPITVTMTIGPGLVSRLGPTATAAIVVVEVSYAATMGRWISRFLYPLGGYLPLGTEFLLYIAHGHTETATAAELLAPTTLRLEPATGRPVARLVADRKIHTSTMGVVDRIFYTEYYTTFTFLYNETVVFDTPGLVLYTVEPGSSITVSIGPAQPSGEPVVVDYAAAPVPFPKSIIEEVLEEGAKPLIIT